MTEDTVDSGGPDAGIRRDAGSTDAGATDAGWTDAGVMLDAGPRTDAGTDAGYDAGSSDAGSSDAGSSDAGTPDAGPSDAGPSDAGPACPWGDAIDAGLPITGMPVCKLVGFEVAMAHYLRDAGFTAGALGVMRDGVIVYERGFGWNDAGMPLSPNAMFRVASLTKNLTATVVRKYITDGSFTLTTPVFPYLQAKLPDAGSIPAALNAITIGHLIDHRGGWDRAVAGDPLFMTRQVAMALGLTRAPTKVELMQYWLTQPLQYTPGVTYAYSNFGYMVLGLAIEKASGKTYGNAVKDSLLTPLGIASEIELGTTIPTNAREPAYVDPATNCADGVNVTSSAYVPCPYGYFDMRLHDANGGLISSTRGMLTFMKSYWYDGQARFPTGYWARFYGSLPGTLTMNYWRVDGRTLVSVLTNQRRSSVTDDSAIHEQELRDLMEAAAAGVTQWP